MIIPFKTIWPQIHETAFVAPSADIIGDVVIGAQSSIWFQVVVRGDVNLIRIGSRTNIQDHAMLHVTRKVSSLHIGDDVTVGHRAVLHGCRVGNQVLVGMGAILLDDCEIGDSSIVAAGAVVPKGMKVPAKSLVVGMPAKVVRELREEECEFLRKSALNYVADAGTYRSYVQGPVRHGSDDWDLETLDVNGFDEEFG